MEKNTATFPYTASKPSKGFTFIEVVIVIAIALIVLLAVGTALYMGSRSCAETRRNTIEKYELLKQFYVMRRQLINLYKDPSHKESLWGTQGIKNGESEIYFLTSSLNKYPTVGEVGYRIMRDEKGNSYLAYIEYPYPRQDERFSFKNFDNKWEVASYLIKKMEIEYEDSNKWLKEWKMKRLPNRVKITFWYKSNEENLKQYTFVVVPGMKSLF